MSPPPRTSLSGREKNENDADEATNWDKFNTVYNMQRTLKKRRIKYSKGTLGVMLSGWFSNILILLFCMLFRMKAGDPIEVNAKLKYSTNPVFAEHPGSGFFDIGFSANWANSIYGNDKKNQTVSIHFAPCNPNVANDPLQVFIDETFSKIWHYSQYGVSNPIDTWNVTCFESEEELELDLIEDAQKFKLAAFVVADPSSLIDRTKAVEYEIRTNQT
jgi:hypothetical protein